MAIWAYLFAQTQNIFLWQIAALSQDVNLLVQDAELPAAVHGSLLRAARVARARRRRLSSLSASPRPRTSRMSAPRKRRHRRGGPPISWKKPDRPRREKKEGGEMRRKKVFASPRHALPIDREERYTVREFAPRFHPCPRLAEKARRRQKVPSVWAMAKATHRPFVTFAHHAFSEKWVSKYFACLNKGSRD